MRDDSEKRWCEGERVGLRQWVTDMVSESPNKRASEEVRVACGTKAQLSRVTETRLSIQSLLVCGCSRLKFLGLLRCDSLLCMPSASWH